MLQQNFVIVIELFTNIINNMQIKKVKIIVNTLILIILVENVRASTEFSNEIWDNNGAFSFVTSQYCYSSYSRVLWWHRIVWHHLQNKLSNLMGLQASTIQTFLLMRHTNKNFLCGSKLAFSRREGNCLLGPMPEEKQPKLSCFFFYYSLACPL